MKRLLSFLVILVISISLSAATNSTDWKLKRNRKGIKVYTKKIEGSTFKAVRAEMLVNATIPGMIALMTDFKSFPKWYPRMKLFESVKEINKLEHYIHIITDAPWPVKDRESVSHFKIWQSPEDKSITIEFRDVPGMLPEKKNMVQVRNLYGKWIFIPQDHDKVKVIYETHCDPGGKLPGWLANATTVDRPYKIFKKMRKVAESGKYRNIICDACRVMGTCK